MNIGQKVHTHCRLKHYNDNEKNKKQTAAAVPNVATAELSDVLDICFFCGNPAKDNHKTEKGQYIQSNIYKSSIIS